MTDEHEDRIFQGVRRMVIWDEPRADVFHRLEVNGLTGTQAQQMYDKARAERIAIIRGDSIRTVVGGLVLLFASASLFFGFWNGWGFISLGSRVSWGALAAGVGVWRFFKGLFGFFLAASKEGSLNDDD
jgi:hypothetical protein